MPAAIGARGWRPHHLYRRSRGCSRAPGRTAVVFPGQVPQDRGASGRVDGRTPGALLEGSPGGGSSQTFPSVWGRGAVEDKVRCHNDLVTDVIDNVGQSVNW